MKRIFDLTISILLLLLLGPIIIITALLVYFKLGSPILFKQKRPGLYGKPFNILKFRTMTNQRDSNDILLPDEVRLTKFGRRMRRLSLDELPQLINVIKGDLSLVGPRPLLMEYLDLYSQEQMNRHNVQPGITGWAQVNGRNALSWEEKFELDLWYVKNQSFWLDLKIMWMTIRKIFKTEGINQQGHVTMEVFKGTSL